MKGYVNTKLNKFLKEYKLACSVLNYSTIIKEMNKFIY